MTDFVPSRLIALRAKLAARKGKKEFAESVKAIEAEIARLEAPKPDTSTADQENSNG